MTNPCDKDRIYLIAHAPWPAPEWFVPKMRPWDGPKFRCSVGDFVARSKSDSDADMTAAEIWNKEKQYQRAMQWPVAWADEQLEQLKDKP